MSVIFVRLRSVFFKTIYTRHSKLYLWINCVSRANYIFRWLLKIAFISQFFSLLRIIRTSPLAWVLQLLGLGATTELVCGDSWSPRGQSRAPQWEKPPWWEASTRRKGQPRLTHDQRKPGQSDKGCGAAEVHQQIIFKNQIKQETLLHSSKETSTEKHSTSVR